MGGMTITFHGNINPYYFTKGLGVSIGIPPKFLVEYHVLLHTKFMLSCCLPFFFQWSLDDINPWLVHGSLESQAPIFGVEIAWFLVKSRVTSPSFAPKKTAKIPSSPSFFTKFTKTTMFPGQIPIYFACRSPSFSLGRFGPRALKGRGKGRSGQRACPLRAPWSWARIGGGEESG